MDNILLDSPKLIKNALELILKMYNPLDGTFSYSSRLLKNKLINDYNNKLRIRYTINSFLGLSKAKEYYDIDFSVKDELDKFISKNFENINNYGDKGLLLYLCSRENNQFQEEILAKLFFLIDKKIELYKLNLQEISWVSLGLIKAYEISKDILIKKRCERLQKIIMTNYWDKNSLFPKHSNNIFRRNFVSFGGITYFLKSLYEYSQVFNDNYFKIIFLELTDRIICLQGKRGEWGWFYNVKKGKVLDWYQIYSVHQHSMSMLFLFPASKLGLTSSKMAIELSYTWLFGKNELGQKMLVSNPFFIYRSIRKEQKHEREWRYLSSLMRNVFPNNPTFKKNVAINKECRSYELGWLLYIWSGVKDYQTFLNLKL